MSGAIPAPIFQFNNRVYAHKKFSNFHLFASIGSRSDAMAAIYFLEQMHNIIVHYYGAAVTIETLRNT